MAISLQNIHILRLSSLLFLTINLICKLEAKLCFKAPMENISKKTVLVIDDEEYICQIMQACLELLSDWKPVTVPCCEEGLAAVANIRPDAILLDMLMPNMDGFAFLKNLQASPEFADIPVVLLTARIDLTEPQKISQLGVKGAIAKPFHPVQIVSQIARILGW